MKLGLVVYSHDPETVWNAFRLANLAKKRGDEVRVFLLGKGVEAESLDTEAFPVREQMQEFAGRGGEILACGTCLQIRHAAGTELCPISTLEDLYKIVRESDKILTF